MELVFSPILLPSLVNITPPLLEPPSLISPSALPTLFFLIISICCLLKVFILNFSIKTLLRFLAKVSLSFKVSPLWPFEFCLSNPSLKCSDHIVLNKETYRYWYCYNLAESPIRPEPFGEHSVWKKSIRKHRRLPPFCCHGYQSLQRSCQ